MVILGFGNHCNSDPVQVQSHKLSLLRQTRESRMSFASRQKMMVDLASRLARDKYVTVAPEPQWRGADVAPNVPRSKRQVPIELGSIRDGRSILSITVFTS